MIRWFKKHFFPHRGNHYHPHILRNKSLSAAIAAMVLIELVMLLEPLVLPLLGIHVATVLPSVVTLLTNNVRAEGHVAEVRVNDVLTLAAQAKADDMVAKGYFAHVSPDGTEPWYWFEQVEYKYQYAGENLAVNFTDSEQLIKAWQDSPTHNLNLLGPRYTETGVGVATGMYQGREAVFVVQFFASPAPDYREDGQARLPGSGGQAPPQNGQVALAVPPASISEEVVVPVSSPEEPEVLSAETQVGLIETEGSSEPERPAPSILARIVLSPLTYGTYALLTLAGLFLIILLIGWGRYHPRALMVGVMVVMLLALVIFMNKLLIFPELKLSLDDKNAATVLYSQ